MWSGETCTLTPPNGKPIQLNAHCGVPVMAAHAGHHVVPAAQLGATRRKPSKAKIRSDRRKRAEARRAQRITANASAVVEGVDEEHRQAGHYPWRGDCKVCCESSMRTEQHRRQLPHAGALAVDLTSVTNRGPYILVGTTQLPEWTYAGQVRT